MVIVLCTTRFRAFCAYCHYCYRRKLLTDKLGEATFVTIGYDNWKKAVECLNQHALSSLHKESLLKIELMKVVPMDAQINSKLKIDQENCRDVLLVVIESLKYLLRQGLAIRGHEEIEGNLMQLLLHQSKYCSKLKQYIDDNHYLSDRIINEIISEIGKSVVRTYLTEIRQAMVYSIIADETTDISRKEQLCVSIRWVDQNFKIEETPIELTDIPKTDGETIATLIQDCFLRHALPISQCRGQAYDGAANMSGHLRGVAARIQNIEPSAIMVHGLAHYTNLCIQSVGRKTLCIREALDVVAGINDLICCSPKRSNLLESLKVQLSTLPQP